MRFMIPLLDIFCFVLLAGCVSTTSEPNSTKTACTACASGDAKQACTSCATSKACSDCKASNGKTACATCASNQACPQCATKDSDPGHGVAEAAADVEPVATIDAKGMSCPLCASNIDRRMKKVGGISWTKIDLGTGKVIVGLEPDAPTPSAEALQQAVNDAGYTAGAVTLPGGEVSP